MKIAIIGTGNMGGAIAKGLIKSGTCSPEEISCTAKSENTLNKLRGYNPVLHVTHDNKEAVQGADIVILAVKPWFIGDVIEEIRPVIDLKHQLIVSVAAGISLRDLTLLLVPDYEQYETEHQAVMRVENPDLEDEAIAMELQKGYMVKGKVIRPSMVQVVANS